MRRYHDRTDQSTEYESGFPRGHAGSFRSTRRNVKKTIQEINVTWPGTLKRTRLFPMINCGKLNWIFVLIVFLRSWTINALETLYAFNILIDGLIVVVIPKNDKHLFTKTFEIRSIANYTIIDKEAIIE